MPTIYHISRPDRRSITDVGSVEAIEKAIRSGEPGRYHIDQISSEPMALDPTSRCWVAKIRCPDDGRPHQPSSRIRFQSRSMARRSPPEAWARCSTG
jgi:hypothetical protein